MKFQSKSRKENGFSVMNPTATVEKILLANGWVEIKYNAPPSFKIDREFILQGSGVFGLWTEKEYLRVMGYLGKHIKKIKENIKIV